MYRHLVRPLLFRLTHDDPEQAHNITVALLHRLGSSPLLRLVSWGDPLRAPSLERRLWDIRFPNPVGLAGGFDKNGEAVSALATLGFGFIEVGTVTLRPQPGSPRPRLFRLPASAALINRMGFNNLGAAALAARLRDIWPSPVPVGVSLGKNKETPQSEAAEDYCQALRLLYPYLDYLAVNVSSPNTPGLRNLQGRGALDALLQRLQQTAAELAAGQTPKPLLLKIAPDMDRDQVLDLLAVCEARGVAGLIATNTTLGRDGLAHEDRRLACQAGGLSGRPLTERSRSMVAFIHRETHGRLPIIGVGGIMEADDALRMLDAGAALVQIYTGLVYRGIGLVREINKALIQRG